MKNHLTKKKLFLNITRFNELRIDPRCSVTIDFWGLDDVEATDTGSSSPECRLIQCELYLSNHLHEQLFIRLLSATVNPFRLFAAAAASVSSLFEPPPPSPHSALAALILSIRALFAACRMHVRTSTCLFHSPTPFRLRLSGSAPLFWQVRTPHESG